MICFALIVSLMVWPSLSTPVADADGELAEYIRNMKVDLYEVYGELRKTYTLPDGPDRWTQFDEAMTKLHNLYSVIYHKFKSYPEDSIKDPDIRRIMEIWVHYGVEDVRADQRTIWIGNPMKLRELGSKKMFCDFKDQGNCHLDYDNDVQQKIANAKTSEELLFYWKQWRSKIGAREVDLLFELANTNAELYRRENVGAWDMFYFYHGRRAFNESLHQAYEDILPLYKQMHAYMRNLLKAKFGEDSIPSSGLIPQHLMDHVLAQISTKNIDTSYVLPDYSVPNFTKVFEEKHLQGTDLTQMAIDFYKSIGLWNASTLIESKMMPCSPKITKLEDGSWKVGVCPKLDFTALLKQYHDMLDIRYKEYYSDFLMSLNKEPTAGFTDAMSNAIKLSVLSLDYLKQNELVDGEHPTQFELYRLFRLGLSAIFAMPLHVVHEKLLLSLMDGNHTPETINTVYAEMLRTYAGIEVPETSEKYELILPNQFLKGVGHAVANTMNIFPEIMGYEFYKALCEKAGVYSSRRPETMLKDCNLYGHTEVGAALSKMMSYGAKEDWWVIAKEVTGKDQMTASGVLEFFEPLQDYFKEHNKNTVVGW